MNTKEAKELVREYEVAVSGVERLADAGVNVVNVRVYKTKVVADVIHLDYSENTELRKNNQKYRMDVLLQFHKTRVLS